MSRDTEDLLNPGRPVSNTPEMRSSVLQCIQDTKGRAVEALEQIQRAKRNLRSLEAKHKRLELQALQLTQLLPGPIVHLPIELLSHIFTLACEGEYVRLYLDEYENGNLPENKVGPRWSTALILMEVCRPWRETVIALSPLWARLDLDARDLHHILGELPSNDSDSADLVDEEEFLEGPAKPESEAARRREASFFACLRAAFARSRHCALDIKLTRLTHESTIHDGSTSALEMVVLHAERIRMLQCKNVTFDFLHCDLDFPSLQELHITNYLPRDDDRRLIPLATPHLTRLTLLNPGCSLNDSLLSDINMTWTSLTTFSLFRNNSSPHDVYPGPSHLLSAVAAMQNLEVFRINLGEFEADVFEAFDPSQSSPTVLARLRTLEIQDHDLILLDLNVIAAFDTPRLERFDYLFHLDYVGTIDLIEKDMSPMISLLNSSTRLKTVNVVYAQDGWMLDLVDNFPEDGYWVAEIPAVKFEVLANLCSHWPTMAQKESTQNLLSPEQHLFTACGARLRQTIQVDRWPEEGYVEDVVGWILGNTDLVPASTYTERKFGLGDFDILVDKLQHLQASVERCTWSFFMQLNLL
ncbi:hypothetical protein BKA70DRAFT_1563578 [Coprinopsis sp. MPI-PUGE-AT-0042]|nr:hypothetical protein BKA70DRAFT_1563578 [Coprinopsis sp. MPI-PUGE-AT-0042]